MRFQVGRRTAAAVVVCALGLSPTLKAAGDAAQAPTTSSQPDAQKRAGLYRIIAGIGIASVGAIFIAKSQTSHVATAGIGAIQGSEPSRRGIIGGIGFIGAGGALIYLGAKNRSAASTHPAVGFTVGPRTTVFVTRRW